MKVVLKSRADGAGVAIFASGNGLIFQCKLYYLADSMNLDMDFLTIKAHI